MPMLIHLLFLSWQTSICTRPLLFLVATCFLSKTSLTVGIPIILWFWYHTWYHKTSFIGIYRHKKAPKCDTMSDV